MKPVNPIKKLGITTLCLALAGALVLGGCGSKPERTAERQKEKSQMVAISSDLSFYDRIPAQKPFFRKPSKGCI